MGLVYSLRIWCVFENRWPGQSLAQGEAMRRKLVWIEGQLFWGWGCSECAWVFNPSGPPIGNSLEKMKHNYEEQRDKDFAVHVCAEYSKGKNTKG
jgi:hypothetical protein